jgi:hypothetical protein
VIDIPPDVILRSINDWCVIHFKDNYHRLEAPSHWYFTIPINPGSLFTLCIITSQVQRRLHYYERIDPKAAQSLVRLEANSFPFITKESLIDCNKAELLSIEELTKRIDHKIGLNLETQVIDTKLREKILKAILNSPLIPPAIKKYF